jgi:hypothetical protein
VSNCWLGDITNITRKIKISTKMPMEYYFQCQQNILSAIPSVFYNTDKIENPNKQFYDEGILLALKNTSEIFIIYQ